MITFFFLYSLYTSLFLFPLRVHIHIYQCYRDATSTSPSRHSESSKLLAMNPLRGLNLYERTTKGWINLLYLQNYNYLSSTDIVIFLNYRAPSPPIRSLLHLGDCVLNTTNISPIPTKFNNPSPRKQYPQPMLCTSDAIIAAATAAAGLRSMLPRAKAPAARWATHDVRKAFEATNIHDIPMPTVYIIISERRSPKVGGRPRIRLVPKKVATKGALGWILCSTKNPNMISPADAVTSPQI